MLSYAKFKIFHTFSILQIYRNSSDMGFQLRAAVILTKLHGKKILENRKKKLSSYTECSTGTATEPIPRGRF